jgi:hypothetical protein
VTAWWCGAVTVFDRLMTQSRMEQFATCLVTSFVVKFRQPKIAERSTVWARIGFTW